MSLAKCQDERKLSILQLEVFDWFFTETGTRVRTAKFVSFHLQRDAWLDDAVGRFKLDVPIADQVLREHGSLAIPVEFLGTVAEIERTAPLNSVTIDKLPRILDGEFIVAGKLQANPRSGMRSSLKSRARVLAAVFSVLWDPTR